jgi:hypothetical protein
MASSAGGRIQNQVSVAKERAKTFLQSINASHLLKDISKRTTPIDPALWLDGLPARTKQMISSGITPSEVYNAVALSHIARLPPPKFSHATSDLIASSELGYPITEAVEKVMPVLDEYSAIHGTSPQNIFNMVYALAYIGFDHATRKRVHAERGNAIVLAGIAYKYYYSHLDDFDENIKVFAEAALIDLNIRILSIDILQGENATGAEVASGLNQSRARARAVNMNGGRRKLRKTNKRKRFTQKRK